MDSRREPSSSGSAPLQLSSSSLPAVGYLRTDPSLASDYLSKTSYLRELEMQQKWEQMVAAEVRRRLQNEVRYIDSEVRRERGGEGEQIIAAEVRQRLQIEEIHIEAEVRREVAGHVAIGRGMEAKEAIEREMALQGANTLNIPILSVPSKMMNQGLSVCNEFKGKLVDAVPFTSKPEDIITDANTSPEPKVDGNILERKRKAPADREEKNKGVFPLPSYFFGPNSPIMFSTKSALQESSKQPDEEKSDSVVQQLSENPTDVEIDNVVQVVSVNHPIECVNCKVGFLTMEHVEAHLKGEDHMAKVLKDSY